VIVEITTFRLAEAAEEADFLATDRAVQAELSANHPGLIRRTTARSRDGDWAVVTLWGTDADAEASDRRWGEPALHALRSMIEPGSLRGSRYADLGG
jgi:heme-degrading monooxygenase HmoA